MEDQLTRAVAALAYRFVTWANQDDGLRDDLRSLAEAVLLSTERPSTLAGPESNGRPAGGDAADVPVPESPAAVAEEPSAVPELAHPTPPVPELTPDKPRPLDQLRLLVERAEPLQELTLGRSRPSPEKSPTVPAVPAAKAATTDADLPDVEARCRLKAEAARWAAERRRLKDRGADHRREIAPRDEEIHDRARGLGCYVWMSTPEFLIPKELGRLGDVAAGFDAVAGAVALVRRALPDAGAAREFWEPALLLLAEAQSALRVAVERVGVTQDREQFLAYDWLRGVAERERIFFPRHMRLGDPADPALLPEVAGRVKDLDAKLRDVLGLAKKRKSSLDRLRYHARLIGEGQGGEHDWRKVAGAVDELVGSGVPASSVEVREALLPILDGMPDLDELPQGFDLTLREVDRYLAGRATPREETADEAPTPEVAEAARLLEGKCVLLIGGARRPKAHEALKAAFGLKDLVWFETKEHESIDVFEPYVVRQEVALVLLAIRWASHSFEGVKKFCERHGKPMVRLPGGYNPNQVAAQVLAQRSRELDRKGEDPQGQRARSASLYDSRARDLVDAG